MKSFKKNSLPFVTVIIPFYNDLDRLRECLICVFLQTYPHDCYEVIVVDNGSDEDFSPLQNKFHDLELLYEYRPGSYAARNTGIRYSKGEVLAFTDSDCPTSCGLFIVPISKPATAPAFTEMVPV